MSITAAFRKSTWVVMALAALLTSLIVPLPGAAQEEPALEDMGDDMVLPDLDDVDLSSAAASEDPLGLVKFPDFMKVHSRGTDIVEVWTCGVNPTPRQLVDRLENNLTPYFKAVSRGRYTPDFRVGGAISSSDFNTCLSRAGARTQGKANVALIAVRGGGGFGGPGTNGPTFPNNQRWVQVGVADAFVTVAAHELGHSLHFPHSYTGRTDGTWHEYDNARDVMSGNFGIRNDGTRGTHHRPYEPAEINRYAAGWIDRNEVRVVGMPPEEFILGPTNRKGLKMAVIKHQDGTYTTLGAGTNRKFDPIRKNWQGINTYRVTKCPHDTINECWGKDTGGTAMGFRRNNTYGRPFNPNVWDQYTQPLGLVIRPGQARTIDGRRVSVRWSEDGTGRFQVRVSAGLFPDARNSVFKKEIRWLTNREITLGCNPPQNTRFCPNDPVIRGEMAAFLHRALPNLPQQNPPTDFADDNNSVFERDIEWLSSRDVTRGCNPPQNTRFCPNDRVTRAEMAAFLHRALPNLPQTNPVTDFADDNNSVFEMDIQWLSSRGITLGCNPPQNTRFCPNEPVTREQMAGFLHRALAN